jgi:integrase
LACTGARLDEIALLEWDQFEKGITKGGEWVHWLDTTDAIVKNATSRRLIPILPKVAELIKHHPRGLNKKEPNRLFTWPKDKADGKSENKASRALMTHLRKVSRDDSFAVHGLRHTVTTMCRVERMDWEMREFMLGRGGSGEGANYGKAAHVETVLDSGMRNFDISFLDGQRAITKQKQITKQ